MLTGIIHANIGNVIRIICFQYLLESKSRVKATRKSRMLGRVSKEKPLTSPTINQLIFESIRIARIIVYSKSRLRNISNGTASNSNSKYRMDPHVE